MAWPIARPFRPTFSMVGCGFADQCKRLGPVESEISRRYQPKSPFVFFFCMAIAAVTFLVAARQETTEPVEGDPW